MAQYETDVKIPVFSGLMQHGDGINIDLRYAVDAANVETPGGVLQPMSAHSLLTASTPKKIETLAVLHTNRPETLADAERVFLEAIRWGTDAPEAQPLIYGIVK